MVEEDLIHWADEKEVVKTNRPLKFLLLLFRHLPGPLVRALIYPVSFFYLIFSKRARMETLRFQNQLREYSGGKRPRHVSSYQQILSFSLCVLEKLQGWMGQVKFSRIEYQNDDINQLFAQLEEGHGAILLTSHLGNMELMRSLSENNTNMVGREVPVLVVMELNSTEQFNKTLRSINPKVSFNIVDAANIGVETIDVLNETIEKGGLVILAGDRTSAYARDKVIVKNFLGKPAPFPYGSFLLPFLMKAPVYYMFGLRSRMSIFSPKYKIFIEKSKIDFETVGRSERQAKIESLCEEFIDKLEKYANLYPYQWYNFFNFWNLD